MNVPRWLQYLVVVLIVLSWVPLVIILRARNTTSDKPPIHLIQDMDDQRRFNPQARNRLFADRRAMRPPVDGTVARGELDADDAFYRGKVGEDWIEAIPIEISMQLMQRGRQRFDIFCSPCHGLDGSGAGMIAKRAEELQEGTWTPPASFHTELVRGRSDGHLFNTISNGIRNMPAYGPQIPVEDRWAIVAYVRALQRSRASSLDDVPAELRAQLR